MEEVMPNPGQPTIGPGATGDVVRRLERALRRTPDLGISVDGVFGPQLEAAVVGDQTWSVSLHAASATLESAVGLNFVID
jgi:peptidoglycan hydrolase-like protein with peptidoglycan-binding domain